MGLSFKTISSDSFWILAKTPYEYILMSQSKLFLSWNSHWISTFCMKNAFFESIVSFHRWDFKNVCFKMVNIVQKTFQYEWVRFFEIVFCGGRKRCQWHFLQYMSLLHAERMRSLNNGKKYTGETYYEAEDPPQSQRIHISDSSQSDSVLRIDFTNDELNSTDIFCRVITEIISRKWQISSNRSFYMSIFLYSMFV